MIVEAEGRLAVAPAVSGTAVTPATGGAATGMGNDAIGRTVQISAGDPGVPNPGGGNLNPAQSGSLEGVRGHEVRDPATGNLITDIDLVEDGVLWEEKSAVFATDIVKWVGKQITGKFHSYLRARQHLPGYENAPIGFRFPGKPADPALEQAIVDEVDSLRRANPGVDIRLEW